jgi:hypothetical protein
MPERNQAARNSHARFMQAVNEELTKIECSERKFRKKDREERAKRLQMPVDNADIGRPQRATR